jgi:hypothetical protein
MKMEGLFPKSLPPMVVSIQLLIIYYVIFKIKIKLNHSLVTIKTYVILLFANLVSIFLFRFYSLHIVD